MTQKKSKHRQFIWKVIIPRTFFSIFEKEGIESESPDLLKLSHQTILCFSHELYYIIQEQTLHLGPLLHLGTFITFEASTKHDKNISYDLLPENLSDIFVMFFDALSWLYQVTSQTNGRVAQWVSDSYWKARTVHSSVIVLSWGRKRLGPGSGVENAMVMKPVTRFCYFFLLPSLDLTVPSVARFKSFWTFWPRGTSH